MKKTKTKAKIIEGMLEKISLLKMDKKAVLEKTGLSYREYAIIIARDIRHIRFDIIYKANQNLNNYYKRRRGYAYQSNNLQGAEKAISGFIYGGGVK